ncbi:rho GTPase-activating protein 27 isoform X2 [Octodon degus]|uniref:Rho GTPase-activating protein 27 isoform X2 n=1 Tax=Octodon degus TaxID=10160 RepID=A0A6P6ENM0_OCTDE|nr:rho GTPase-activating protein 27 isoform X2 [Octodon degus]
MGEGVVSPRLELELAHRRQEVRIPGIVFCNSSPAPDWEEVLQSSGPVPPSYIVEQEAGQRRGQAVQEGARHSEPHEPPGQMEARPAGRRPEENAATVMAADVEGEVDVLVEHPFEYTGRDGRHVTIRPDERYRLLRRSTPHWWQVRREPGGRPFYLPAQYVRELPALGSPTPPARAPRLPVPGLPARMYARPAAPVRPAHSLDDLARAATPPGALLEDARRAKACSVAGSWVCPRPLARSGSEDVDEAATEGTPEQVEAPAEPVYANVGRTSTPLPRAPAAPRPDPACEAWEEHTDTDSGRHYYYNRDTGATTWEPPGEDSPAASPASVGSRESLESEWDQYWDEESRRVFFYNPLTGETAWEDAPCDRDEEGAGDAPDMQPGQDPGSPTRRRPPTPEADYPESLSSYPEEDYPPAGCLGEPSPTSPLSPPPGWSCHLGPEQQTLYTNHFTGEQWVQLEDQHGKTYFYRPQDSSVRWELPQVPIPAPRSIRKTSQDGGTPAPASPSEEKIKTLDKAGVLHCTRTADKGKRLRKKHWSTSWSVLEGSVLTFFKDSKTSAAGGLRQQPSKLSTPEYTVELKGASLSWAPKDKSSKKNVLELRSRDGSEYLIQHDSEDIISAWHKAITQGIQERPIDPALEEDSEASSTDFKLREREDTAATPSPSPGTLESDLSRVRQKLRRFLQRRPTLQSLRERGYIKDQVFGCSLATLCTREKSSVPRFVQQCVRAVEARGLDTDGLYRISGNLATIQKLRYHVDHDEHLDLDDGRWDDVHVVTGALKLFLQLQDPARRSRCVRDLVRSLPTPNHDTLRLLFQHLRRVVDHGEQNRMSVQSMAIVFGPTLLRPETEGTSMPMTMVFQNQVVELILQQCADIFPPC